MIKNDHFKQTTKHILGQINTLKYIISKKKFSLAFSFTAYAKQTLERNIS